MNPPTWDEAKARAQEIRERRERRARDLALREIGEALVREWDPTLDTCLVCCASVDERHVTGCPIPLVEAYRDEHGR